ncbi:MarR family [Slackia heliotrinireducens]|uniref:HTH marR-type domain-containing protein n=1 Tax=Slackia heliotrinireducens (strain ATCC 29202 / DSM 20476 / NCTC 11029 / RHS 1) TaxID=471855 RepID=C7N7D2_SLAHD|nr:MarR family transcriptional regulator [Slackia heliotrinireducens]ACV22817.1 hypothetical protein Shel_17980 [Slackia heliotrinireducens DSM 20476]VEH01536.1 MarR family [Slackia heliotrinireducens]
MERFEQYTLSLFTINRYWNRIAAEEMQQYGMKGTYALYLEVLAAAGKELTAARLAEITQRDKADISRAVAVFQEKGLVEPYGEKRYRAPIILTDEGRAVAEQVQRKAAATLEAAGQGLSEEVRENVYQGLAVIAKNMREFAERNE